MLGPKHEFDNRRLAAAVALALVVIGWIIILAGSAWMMKTGDNALCFGLFFGALFGQVTVAAAWTVLGPGAFVLRLPLAMAWCVALTLACCIPMWVSYLDSMLIVIFGLLVGSLWLALQVPLWGAVVGLRMRLRYQGPLSPADAGMSESQFGIRQLMMFTAIVAVALGVGRACVPVDAFVNMEARIAWVIGLLVAFQLIKSAPLVLALFLGQHARLAVLLSLVLIAGVTFIEDDIITRISGQTGGPGIAGFAIQNLISSLCVGAFGVLVCWSGYSFGLPRDLRPAA